MPASRDVVLVMSGAIAIGAVVGIASTSGSPAEVATTGRAVAARVGLVRRRPPQAGDAWGGCNDARAAGTSPIYRGESGYRPDMDGDSDGIACEPVP